MRARVWRGYLQQIMYDEDECSFFEVGSEPMEVVVAVVASVVAQFMREIRPSYRYARPDRRAI